MTYIHDHVILGIAIYLEFVLQKSYYVFIIDVVSAIEIFPKKKRKKNWLSNFDCPLQIPGFLFSMKIYRILTGLVVKIQAKFYPVSSEMVSLNLQKMNTSFNEFYISYKH